MRERTNKLDFEINVDGEKLKTAVAEIESAFPKIIFNGDIKKVYVSYTQNNFSEEKHQNEGAED